MTDYTELVKKLRDLHRDPRPASAVWLFDNQIALYDAAAAIEDLEGFLAEAERDRDEYEERMEKEQDRVLALQAEVERLKDCNEELREKQTFIDHYGTEWMTSAKDVPTSAYQHGYADGFAEARAKMDGPIITPCRGCSDYDGYGGCKSKGGCARAKMEVQE